jgi:hypothetical protein
MTTRPYQGMKPVLRATRIRASLLISFRLFGFLQNIAAQKKKQTYALIKYRAKKNLPLLQAGPRAGCAAGSNADCLAAQLAAQLAAIDVSKRGSQLQTRTPNHSTRTTYLSLRSWS